MAIQYGRLLKLAGVLENLPRKDQFNYRFWVDRGWNGRGAKSDLSCGTSACALGWATTIPEFQELGMRLVADGDSYGHVVIGSLENSSPDHASAVVFGLNTRQHLLLFHPSYNRLGEDASAEQVAAHIREFVADEQAKDPEWQKQEAEKAKAAAALSTYLADEGTQLPAEPQRQRMKVGD